VDAAVDLAAQQACRFQDPQVLGDGRKRHVKGLGQLGDRSLALREARENGAAGGIGERAKGGIQRRIARDV
jgi:hypothetical protein